MIRFLLGAHGYEWSGDGRRNENIFIKSRRLRVAIECKNEGNTLLTLETSRLRVGSRLCALMPDATREVLIFQPIEHFQSIGQLDRPQKLC
jgi:hypothetical protein